MGPLVAVAMPRGCRDAHGIQRPPADTIVSDFAERIRQPAIEPRIYAGICRLDWPVPLPRAPPEQESPKLRIPFSRCRYFIQEFYESE